MAPLREATLMVRLPLRIVETPLKSIWPGAELKKRESSTEKSPFRLTDTVAGIVLPPAVVLESLPPLMLTMLPAAPEPRDWELPTPIVPLFKTNSPRKPELVPLKVNAPEPFFTNLPADVLVMTEEHDSPAGSFRVSVFPPKAMVPPVPETDFTVSL